MVIEKIEESPLTNSDDITQLLKRWSDDGDQNAFEKLTELVYEDLLKIARLRFAKERKNHTLQPTALVSELYFRLDSQRRTKWKNRLQFFAFASEAIRRILVDHARRHKAVRRGGQFTITTFDAALQPIQPKALDLLDLELALEKLEQLDCASSKIVVARFFGGLTYDEIASHIGLESRTVRRRWDTARLWLRRELKGESTH